MNYKDDLKKKLGQLKAIEGFPIASDEAILSLSSPPNYTACPNPYINDFILKNGSVYDEKKDRYIRKPYTDDIDTNKNDKLTNAHSYHTKSPFHAIQQCIEHYTSPGDIVLDCFSGSGMTSIAAQKSNRKAVLLDLSPIASYITYNYGNSTSSSRFLEQAGIIVDELENELGWLNITRHANGQDGVINSVMFSEMFSCPYCHTEFVLWDYAVDLKKKDLLDPFECKSCKASIKKAECNKVFEDYYDPSLRKTFNQAKTVPVEILYTYGGKRFKKLPDEFDLELIEKTKSLEIPYWHPTESIPDGHNLNQPKIAQGYLHTHHLFTSRNLYLLSALYDKVKRVDDVDIRDKLKIAFNSLLLRSSRKAILQVSNYFHGGGGYITTISGNWYIPSLNFEVAVIEQFKNRVVKINEINLHNFSKENIIVSTQSATDLSNINSNSIDYIFVDPPFGENLMYSELNYLYESWNDIITNNSEEAIMNSFQNKGLDDYNGLMQKAFQNLFRVLKPNRWITIEYHNSKSAIWNGLQEALNKAGFLVAHTSILKNKGGSFIINVSPNSVSNDLMINAYKPSEALITKLNATSGVNVEEEFVHMLLNSLPVRPMIERTEKMLYSKMVGYYIQRNYELNYDAKSFYQLLFKNFIEQDGYWFTYDQINSFVEFKKKLKIEGFAEHQKGSLLLFISDEKSAIFWLNSYLSEPRSFSDIHTAFTKLVNIHGDKVPDLKALLDENFINTNDLYRRPTTESEFIGVSERREKVLKKEFETLLIKAKTEKGKIKSVRKEALVFGFELCYKAKRHEDILTIAKKLDKAILENSTELNDFVEAAEIMVQGVA